MSAVGRGLLFEFVKRIADEATVGTMVRLPPVLVQSMAAEDVAKAVGRVAVGAPVWIGQTVPRLR